MAFGLVILTIWALVGWYVVQTPRELLARQRQELATGVRAIAMQTEPVLRQAEDGLRVVDLWLLNRRDDRAATSDTALRQLADTLHTGSGQFVDIVLVSAIGGVHRLQSGVDDDDASIAGTAAFEQFNGLVPEGIAVSLPLRLGGRNNDSRLRLPLLMRLSRPFGDRVLVMALIDLDRLRQAQGRFVPPPPTSLVMLRRDGVALERQPEAPGFVGRNIFEQFPAARRELSGQDGFFASTGAASDGRARTGAFITLGDQGVKLLLSSTEAEALSQHWRQRTQLLILAGLATLGLVLLGRWLGLLQRAARLREATMRATSNAMPLGLFRADETGRIVYANDSYLRIHGLKREDIAWGWTTLVRPEQRDALVQRWQHQMASGEPIDTVRKLKRGDDGRIRWISLRTAPLYFNGRVAGQAGTVEDVTERGEQERARQTLAAVFDMTPDFVCQANEQGRVTYLNPAARTWLGMPADAPLDEARMADCFSAEQIELYEKRVLPQALREGHWRGRANMQLRGARVPMDCLVIIHRDVRGRVETVSVILRDLSEQLRAQRERERGEAMLLAVAHSARAHFLVGDTEARVIFCNTAFEAAHGIQLKDWIGRPLADVFGPRNYGARAPLVAGALKGETCRQEIVDTFEREGRSMDVQYAPLRVQSGKIEGLIAIELDVTDARREQARLHLASQTDALTQLLNRAGFEDGARRLLAAPAGQRLALLYLDLDKFKPVNDRHGHPTGDALLKAVALRLRHALRPSDLVGRLGGDEFAVLLPELHDASDAATVSAKLRNALSTPFHIGALQLEIGVSIGFCVATTGELSLEPLVQQADAHLYEAKRAGRNCWRGGAL